MQIETWPIESIKPCGEVLRTDHEERKDYGADPSDPGASRSRPGVFEEAVVALAASIGHFGFRQPIVVDAQGTVLAGEARLAAARRLGLADVPVHVARDLTPEQCRAYRIADRSVGDRRGGQGDDTGPWDADAMARQIEGMGEEAIRLLDAVCPAVRALLDGPYPLFGQCPECSGGSMCHIGRAEWGFCDEHRLRWSAGENVISSWREQTGAHWRSNWERIGPYREVRGVFPTPESEAARRLARRPWLRRPHAAIGAAAATSGA